MKFLTLSRLGLKHAGNAFAEAAYLKSGVDYTRPVTFYGLVNERCNVKCRYCEFWRLKEYATEMSIEEWQQALSSVKKFVGEFSINFSGGEPFLKKGFIDLMVWCHENGIHSGVTTNGSALNEGNVRKLVAARPFNVNISVDAPSAEEHDYLRGAPGLFDKLCRGIALLRRQREAAKADFPIIIKPTINSRNFRRIPDLVEWAQSIGATAVNFQPMDRWTPETYDELWVEEEELADLETITRRLLAMKRAGAPILNSELIISKLPAHFRGEKAPRDVLPCRVGMRDFFILANGDVKSCFHFPVIGNLKQQSASEIWQGERASGVRAETVSCERLCLYTCLSQKTLKDKVRMAIPLLVQPSRTAA